MRKVLLGIAILSLSACQTLTVAEVGNYESKGGATVNLNQSWTSMGPFNTANGDLLTQDGVSLNRLHIVTLEDGDVLVKSPDKSREYPKFATGMSEIQKVEFLTASLASIGFDDVEMRNVAPAPVGGVQGAKMEIAGKYASGLNMRGLAAMAETENGLTMLFYIAPEMHYFEKDRASVENMISTLQISG